MTVGSSLKKLESKAATLKFGIPWRAYSEFDNGFFGNCLPTNSSKEML